MARKVLMISYFFPPIGGIAAAGSQRTLKFAKYLPHYGWQPVILTARESSYESYFALDPTLLERVPPTVTVVRCTVFRGLAKLLELKNRRRNRNSNDMRVNVSSPATQPIINKTRFQRLKDALTSLFEIPDGEIGWLLPAIATALRTVKRQKIDVIYATGKPWTAHLVGVALKRLTGKPLVIDFRDPWVTNPFREPMSELRCRIEAYLERKITQAADVVIANTEDLKEEFRVRFPDERPGKFVALLNGFDPEDHRAVPRRCTRKAELRITHTGFLYGKRDPKLFLEAVATIVEAGVISRRELRVCFVGHVELPYDLAQYLRDRCIDDIVELVAHVPYDESLRYLADSDALLLLQPGTHTQVPSKLFEYIGLGKPILAISCRNGATARLVQENRLGLIADDESVSEIALAIQQLHQLCSQTPTLSPVIEYGRDKFNVKNLTGSLAQEFDAVVGTPSAQ